MSTLAGTLPSRPQLPLPPMGAGSSHPPSPLTASLCPARSVCAAILSREGGRRKGEEEIENDELVLFVIVYRNIFGGPNVGAAVGVKAKKNNNEASKNRAEHPN